MWGHMSTTDLPGSSLLASRYRLVERLGAGGMSVVWRGFDEVLGRQVAVKVLPPSTSADPSFRRRLRAEAQAAARLSHPNITNVYDYGEAITVDGEPVPYVVMELIDGESLAAVLARARKLPWQHAVRITAEVAAALAAAHSRGIVHRDVTPANVMLTSTGAKVVDFGISALIGENDIDPDGSLLGTPAYLAPERLEGGQVSPATDVYAVGLLIYRTLIGQLPWDVGTTTALLRAHQYTEPEPLPPVEGLPPAVDALVGRCLEKRPADRPSSAELAHVLAGISAGAPSVARGYVPDWSSDSGEDTTILPAQWSYHDVRKAGSVSSPPVAPVAQVSPAASGAAAVPAAAAPAAAAAVAAAAAAASAPEEPAAPVRNSRFAALRTGPVVPPPTTPPNGGPALRAAYGNEPDRAGGSTGNRPTGFADSKTRRILVVAAGVVLVALGAYGFSFTSGDGQGKDLSALPQPSVVPASGKCVVSYAVQADANGQFVAQVTVANRAETAVKDWRLWFIMPGDQVLSGRGKVTLVQEDRTVTLKSSAPLNGLKSMTVPVYGRYDLNNTAPLAFSLNNQTCETFVSGKPGEPSRQVEHLSNGEVRLGPTPTGRNPIPGVSVGPGGVVTISPTIPRTTAPTATATVTVPTTQATTPQSTPTSVRPDATKTVEPEPNDKTTQPEPDPTTPTPSPTVAPTVILGEEPCSPELDICE